MNRGTSRGPNAPGHPAAGPRMHGERGCYDRDTHTQTDVTVLDLEESSVPALSSFRPGAGARARLYRDGGGGAGGMGKFCGLQLLRSGTQNKAPRLQHVEAISKPQKSALATLWRSANAIGCRDTNMVRYNPIVDRVERRTLKDEAKGRDERGSRRSTLSS